MAGKSRAEGSSLFGNSVYFAVDGSHVHIPSDIHDEATYFNSTKNKIFHERVPDSHNPARRIAHPEV